MNKEFVVAILLLASTLVLRSSASDSEEDLFVKEYSVKDLLPKNGDGTELQELVQSTIDSWSWSAFGGDGTLLFQRHKMSVRQTSKIHTKLGALLQSLGKCPMRGSGNDPTEKQMRIGTKSSQDQGLMDIVVYPVEDILRAKLTSPASLLETIRGQAGSPNDWDVTGGENFLAFFAHRPAIVATSFPNIHRQIVRIIQRHRKAARLKRSPDEIFKGREREHH